MMTPPSASQATTDDVPAFLEVDHSANGRKWVRRSFDARSAEHMAQSFGLDPMIAEMMAARGVTVETAQGWLQPSLKAQLPNPSVMTDMDKAATRIAEAVEQGEKIGVFGDYDVDGTTSSALLARYFRALSVPYHVHLPDRQLEGYGPNLPAFLSMKEQGVGLIITVDCGAMSHEVIGHANDEGLEVIVLDHHGMTLPPPPALAVVNPNRPDCPSGLRNLSAGAVTFMAMIAINRELRGRGWFAEREEPKLLQWIDLVALSLVCDVMSLTGLSRVLTKQGLSLLQDFDLSQSGNPGIRALAAEAGAKGTAQAYHFGYSVGPRINAAGRIGHARQAFELLETDDPERAQLLAERLSDLNGVRRGVEAAVLEAAVEAAEAKGGRDSDRPLIVADEGWHPGVIGIVAGRLKERFDRPAIVISFEGEEGKGSGRSLPGVDLGAAIGRAAKAGVIVGGGGHPMAAGLSLRKDQLDAFEAFLAQDIGEATEVARASQRLSLDGMLSPMGLTRSFCDLLGQAAPFGNGNPEPRFALAHVRVRDSRILKDKHMSLTVEDRSGRRARGICFGCIGAPLGDFLEEASRSSRFIHLAGRAKPDDYRGGEAAQFHVEDAAWAG